MSGWQASLDHKSFGILSLCKYNSLSFVIKVGTLLRE